MRPPSSIAPSSAARPGYYRWVICGLLFFATTINYIDRQVIGILKPTLVKTFQWQDERVYAAIIFSFQLAYAVGLLVAGRVVDRIGIRRGLALAVVLWSVAAVAHGAAAWFPALQLPTLNLDAATGFSGNIGVRMVDVRTSSDGFQQAAGGSDLKALQAKIDSTGVPRWRPVRRPSSVSTAVQTTWSAPSASAIGATWKRVADDASTIVWPLRRWASANRHTS